MLIMNTVRELHKKVIKYFNPSLPSIRRNPEFMKAISDLDLHATELTEKKTLRK